MIQTVDVVVVGAGIVGLAHAWAAARRGRSVVVLERGPVASGASVRNFGMVWPVGQPAGVLPIALRSRALWLEAAAGAGFWHHTRGSVFLAVHEDELAVMREFVEGPAAAGYDCAMLTRDQVLARCPAANRAHVIGGFASTTEVGVDPREAIATLPLMLAERHGVRVFFNTPAVRIEPGVVHTADGTAYEARERVVVCSGAETRALFPEVFDRQGLTLCKLQMLATGAQPAGWSAGPLIASGPTLRHYTSFAGCPTLGELKRRIAEQTPELDAMGIHFMAAQNGAGEVVLGDSHEYGEPVSPFDRGDIDAVMLRGLRELLDLPDWTVARRWHGVYLKAPGRTHFVDEPLPGVTVFNGLGGAGMTLSFGLADAFWEDGGGTTQPTTTHTLEKGGVTR
jgi:FAD dependent oxidoreductase TIGR03364